MNMNNPNITFINDVTSSKYVVNLDENNKNKIIYSFNEFAKISICSNTSIEIMVNSYIVNKNIVNVLDKYLKIKKNTIYHISFTDSNFNSYIPGIYEIKYNNNVYYFRVNNNNNVFDDTRNFMATEINKLNSNLISDYSTLNKYSNGGVSNLSEINDFLNKNYADFYLNFQKAKIIKNVIVKERELKKQNYKTTRLNSQKPSFDKFYNVKKEQCYDFDINLLNIKKVLEKFNSLEANKYKENLVLVNNSNITNKNNKFFRDFYKSLKTILENNYIYKSSMVIFEMFSLILIIDALNKLGFDLKNEAIDYTEKIIFTRENIKIEILYDRKLEKNSIEENHIYSLNSSHNKPDFVLVILENNSIKDVVIIDSKYRNIDSLRLDKDKILEICYDYYQLVTSGIRRPKQIVSDVLIFYPNLEDTYFEYEVGYFLGYKINEEVYDSRCQQFLIELLKEKCKL